METNLPVWAVVSIAIYSAVVVLGFLIYPATLSTELHQTDGQRKKARAEGFLTFLGILVWPVFVLWYLPLGIKGAAVGIIRWIRDVAAGLKQIIGEKSGKI